MKPYGLKPRQFRDEECGPPTKCGKLSSKHRREARRAMHKAGRNEAKKVLKEQVI